MKYKKNSNKIKKSNLRLLLLFHLIPTFILAQATANEERVVIEKIIGQAEVSSPTTSKWRPARIGMRVRKQWKVRTYMESAVILRFQTGTSMKIGEKSVILVDKIVLEQQQNTTHTSVKVGTGKVWANVKKLSGQSKFDFETPTAVASIRGTRLRLHVSKDQTIVDVYKGLVMFKNRNGSPEPVSVSSNHRAIVRRNTESIKLMKMDGSDDQNSTPQSAPDTMHRDSLADTLHNQVAPDSTFPSDSTYETTPDSTHEEPSDESDTLSETPSDTTPAYPSASIENNAPSLSQSPFFLKLESPQDNSSISKPIISVVGQTHPEATVRVNNSIANVSTQGMFIVQVPIPDEPQKYEISVQAHFNGDESTVSRIVEYKPPEQPLFLTVNSPHDGQKIGQKIIPIRGTTSPRTMVSVNGRPATVTPQGIFSLDIPIFEKDIGEYLVEITVANNNEEQSEALTVVVDDASPAINTSAPALVVMERGRNATTTGTFTIQVTDRTPGDEITLETDLNGVRENYTVYPGSRQQLHFEEGKNTFQLRAYDKAHNNAPPVQGERYYLPGPISIDIREPSITMRHVADLPPMPSTVGKPRMRVEVEIDDGIGTVPETIRYCRLSGNGQSIQLVGTGDYLYSGEVILIRGRNTFTIQAEDMAGNKAVESLTVMVE